VVLQVRDKGIRGEGFFRLAERVAYYRSLGYRVAAIEDDRISHSGLEHLWRQPPDFVKLDHGLIAGAVRHDWERHRLNALLSTIHHLGAQVMQDGVEDEEQVRIATEAGVDLVKGHYLGKPHPASELSDTPCASLERRKNYATPLH
jgi:EAL domain-containing protein (putative c-di-GMP-specific phosphodiesterase class I)